jgi:hypothetical protein
VAAGGVQATGLGSALKTLLQAGRLALLAKQNEVAASVPGGGSVASPSCVLPTVFLRAIAAGAGRASAVPAADAIGSPLGCGAYIEGVLSTNLVTAVDSLANGPLTFALVVAAADYSNGAFSTLTMVRDRYVTTASIAAIAFLLATYVLLVPTLLSVNAQLYQVRALLLAIPLDLARSHARVLAGLYKIAAEVTSGSWLKLGEGAALADGTAAGRRDGQDGDGLQGVGGDPQPGGGAAGAGRHCARAGAAAGAVAAAAPAVAV